MPGGAWLSIPLLHELIPVGLTQRCRSACPVLPGRNILWLMV
jgi:hypothetical protein